MVSLAFNDNAFDFWGGFHLGKDEESQILLGGRYLYESDKDAKVPAALLLFSSRPAGSDEIDFSLGAQVVFGEAQNVDAEGVSVGGMGSWTPDGWKGAYVGGRLFWAPSVFCFGSTDGLFEWGIEGGYKFNPRMGLFVEYSDFEADDEIAGSFTVDDGWKIGFRATF
jgi:hypothetical protein